MLHLMNVNNVWDRMIEEGIIEGQRESITEMEVERAIVDEFITIRNCYGSTDM